MTLISIGLRMATIGQRTRQWHEDNQSDNRDNDHHDDDFGIAETLARNHQSSCNIALCGTKGYDASRVGAWSTEQPTNPETYCDKQKSGKDSSCAEDL